MRKTSLLALLLVSSGALAQSLPLEFGIGYGRSASFDKNSGGRGSLTGIEISASQRLLSVPMLGEAQIGASILFGGALSHGGDADGTVYRFFARGRSKTAGTGFYGIGGAYIAFASGRGGSFGNVNGVGLELGAGIPLSLGKQLPGMPSSSLEFVTHQGSNAQTRGWSLGLVFRM